MEPPLDPTECRIIGVLIEKQLATPEYYPMTVNALVAGCNQKNNRDPETHYQDFEIEGALRSLYVKKWVTNTNTAGRAIKWLHRIDESLGLDRARKAVLAELMLRGPQQPGELRTRASRMAPHELASAEGVTAALDGLAAMTPPYARCVGRRSGERFDRWTHLLSVEAAATAEGAVAATPGAAAAPASATAPHPHPEPAAVRMSAPAGPDLASRVAALEAEVAALRREIERLSG